MHNKIKLYCITTDRQDLSHEEQADLACAGGADAVRLRTKKLSAREIISVGRRIKDICAGRNVLFMLDDRPDLALAVDPDGLHLGQDDAPVSIARSILGRRKIISCAVSTLGQALAAESEGANIVMVGPIFGASAAQRKEARGLDIIRMVKERLKIPVVASGGIDGSNIDEALDAGVDGIAVKKAVCGARQVREAAKALKDLILKRIVQE